MKELELSAKDKTELIVEQHKQIRRVDRIIPHPGHSIFEVNVITGEVKKVEYERGNVVIYSKGRPRTTPGKIVVKKDCYYVSALNKKNAIKKIEKMDKAGKANNGSRIDPRKNIVAMKKKLIIPILITTGLHWILFNYIIPNFY